jgi:hypothetical protein
VLSLLLSFLISTVAPQHDFHASWMNITYNEGSKSFESTWRTDTEHLEGVLTAYAEQEIHLDNSTIGNYKLLINNYIKDNATLYLNAKNQNLTIDIIEVNFAETIVHFKPIKCRRKLKQVSMQNTLLQKQFPNQKNMVQLNYEGKMYSLLLGANKQYEEIIIEQRQ